MHLVAVLGYSARRADGLHELCAARLRHAEQLVARDDVVFLSGWSRHRGRSSEAELMRQAWNVGEVQIIRDSGARSTAENAASVAGTARRLGATEVTVVTSRWHAFRAGVLVRAALPSTLVRTSSPPGRPPITLLARELACLAVLPYQLIRLRGRGREVAGVTKPEPATSGVTGRRPDRLN
jgi:uncharacterized SAM-binding protein YcdF (DUF218 family)